MAEKAHNVNDDLMRPEVQQEVQEVEGNVQGQSEENFSDKICVICDKQLTPETSYHLEKKAIESLVAASRRRKDIKYLKFEQLSSLWVHKNCNNVYKRESSIVKAEKEASAKCSSIIRINKEARKFDFSMNCFFCGLEAIQSTRRNPVSIVSSDQTRSKMLETLILRLKDDFNRALESRLQSVEDLSEVEARYHRECFKKFYDCSTKNILQFDDDSANSADAYQFIINYIESHKEECQFSLRKIIETCPHEVPEVKFIKSKLYQHFQDDICHYDIRDDTIFCLKKFKDKVLAENWKMKQAKTEKEKRLETVQSAAKIILQDIRSHYYDTQSYKSPSSFFENFSADIPETLKAFMDIVIITNKELKHESSKLKWDKRVTTLSHCIISSVRPRSFLSPILLGLSSMLHKKHASKGLIDSLSFLGLCSSYNEALLFEAAIVKEPERFKISDDGYVQFVFDNADHNTNTIDGLNTFHAMGGIMCVTPSESVTSDQKIQKLKKMPSSKDTPGFLKIQKFERGSFGGLKSIIIKDVNHGKSFRDDINITSADILWLFGKHSNPSGTSGWNGFMESFHKSKPFMTTRVIPLRFANAIPSHEDTILTVLIEAAIECMRRNRTHCFVTFLAASVFESASYFIIVRS